MDSALTLKAVSHSYNIGAPIEKNVLSDITLKIKKGERVGIMGPPASGKTSLAMLMAGLTKPARGCINTPGTGRKRVGIVFQFPERQLFGHTVFDDITFTLREVEKLPAEEVERAYAEVCGKVGLDARMIRVCRPIEMSSGEQRRIAIAGTLAFEPEILIFDEPTVGLDPHARRLLLDEINRLAADGRTTVIISHDIEDILYTSDRMIYLENGRIAEDGPAKDTLRKLTGDEEKLPYLPFTTELLVRIKKGGLDVRTDIFDPEEALTEIMSALEKR